MDSGELFTDNCLIIALIPAHKSIINIPKDSTKRRLLCSDTVLTFLVVAPLFREFSPSNWLQLGVFIRNSDTVLLPKSSVKCNRDRNLGLFYSLFHVEVIFQEWFVTLIKLGFYNNNRWIL